MISGLYVQERGMQMQAELVQGKPEGWSCLLGLNAQGFRFKQPFDLLSQVAVSNEASDQHQFQFCAVTAKSIHE